MLEHTHSLPELTKAERKERIAALEAEIELLSRRIKDAKIPVVILFEGWSASGKGSVLSKLILNIDPRNYKVHSTTPPEPRERRRPFLARYWSELPAQGRFAIFDRSWYQDLSIYRRDEGFDDDEFYRRVRAVNTMERQLTDGGTLILKFFLHIDRDEQAHRLDELAASEVTRWRVTERDRDQNEHYKAFYRLFDEMLESTDTACAPWHVIAAEKRTERLLAVYSIVVAEMRRALEEGVGGADAALPLGGPFDLLPAPDPDEIDLSLTLDRDEYKRRLKLLQGRLSELHSVLYHRKMPVILVYEGYDAAGKGGNIRRVAAALDPRGYEVVPVAAPNPYEIAHHYLWRFWTRLPLNGHIGIFDRSWYGRVLVERVEGFCSERDYRRAYQEINEFERELMDFGAVILKFWVHIDKDEQLRRFEDRQNTPEKQWKITDEDWRNREKWPQYEAALRDMLRYTSTARAPWHIIESNDKKFARIKTLSLIVKTLEQALDGGE
ncbi:polyphosphate:AMP phosphotransferase [Feifania hominis]|uniref:Polyphosphate:AMP phosphotransferase n=1 Tax=Feifania hominis TaxID=2763660 RepID=A0A926HU34_9FIRM|nr:polyphosphate:AMP phosphotransferase [Feifania hominis]MBC8536494.1 polyphosphate:AMP phosphotransferase [Feifania hominis]